MPNFTRRTIALASLATLATALAPKDRAFAQKKYGPGVSDTEIKVGQTIAYSGPASAYGQIGQAEAAFFKMINDRGGINGRKITFISVDDSYSPPKAVEQTRRLVEQDEVGRDVRHARQAAEPGHPHLSQHQQGAAAVRCRGLRAVREPGEISLDHRLSADAPLGGQLLRQADPRRQCRTEDRRAHQYDDFGKELLSGLNDGLGPKATAVIAAESFAPIDPSIDSQIVKLKSAGADTVLLFSYAKQAAQAIRKIRELNWKPDIYLHSGASSVSATLVPAGLEHSIDIKTARYAKDASDPQWLDDPELKPFYGWIKQYVPTANPSDTFYLSGWTYGQMLVQVLRQCGDDLTRENIMRQATSLKDFRNPALLPGSLINTSPTDYRVVKYMRLERFNGKTWESVGT